MDYSSLFKIWKLYFVAFPQKRSNDQSKVEFKDEKRYPNGTVIGKYSYRDKDGNPVHIKYFADDSSYGWAIKYCVILL